VRSGAGLQSCGCTLNAAAARVTGRAVKWHDRCALVCARCVAHWPTSTGEGSCARVQGLHRDDRGGTRRRSGVRPRQMPHQSQEHAAGSPRRPCGGWVRSPVHDHVAVQCAATACGWAGVALTRWMARPQRTAGFSRGRRCRRCCSSSGSRTGTRCHTTSRAALRCRG